MVAITETVIEASRLKLRNKDWESTHHTCRIFISFIYFLLILYNIYCLSTILIIYIIFTIPTYAYYPLYNIYYSYIVSNTISLYITYIISIILHRLYYPTLSPSPYTTLIILYDPHVITLHNLHILYISYIIYHTPTSYTYVHI